MDIYSEITDRLVKEMEGGEIPWLKPWLATGAAISHATGKPYSLLNQFLLGRPGEYLTYKQAIEEGGNVRKGEKSRMVVFWKWIKEKDEETGEEREIPFLRYYNVFHVDQCEGIKPKYERKPETPATPCEAAEAIANEYITREGITLKTNGCNAYYAPAADTIVVPNMEVFEETAEYYSTLFHEMVHSTGHSKRLARIADVAAFGSETYSKEELVAEIGSATLVHHVGLETPASFRNNAAYIQNWLKALKNDKRLIVSAAGKAEKAVNMILNVAP